MVDFHTHILPGVDDGSRSMDETRELLNMELENGVTQIVFTPHFYADQMSIKTFLAKRQTAYEQVMQEMKDDTRFERFYLGAEVAYFPGMSKAEQLEVLCIQGTKVILVEMPFAQWTEEVYRELEYIVKKRKLTVILVHLERYAEFQKKKKVWNKVLELPIHVQINGGAVINRRRRRFVLQFLKKNPEVVLGSDSHNTTTRKPNLKEARMILADKFGKKVLTKIDNYGKKLLELE